jgi:hypothetical protein
MKCDRHAKNFTRWLLVYRKAVDDESIPDSYGYWLLAMVCPCLLMNDFRACDLTEFCISKRTNESKDSRNSQLWDIFSFQWQQQSWSEQESPLQQ